MDITCFNACNPAARCGGVFLPLLLALAAWPADAALLSRAGGQAWYDTTGNITWVADANLAKTSGYDADGLMSWSASLAWIASLNAASYLGKNDWRLPKIVDTGTPGCNLAYTGTDCGYSVDLTTGEMANLFYGTLGNSAGFDTSAVQQACVTAGPAYCVTNAGPFVNLRSDLYWSGTEYTPNTANAWYFGFGDGFQGDYDKTHLDYAWAVRDGDIGAVPLPAAAWLFTSALALLGLRRRTATA